MIHMKYQDLFSSENKKKTKKLSSVLVVIGALRVKVSKYVQSNLISSNTDCLFTMANSNSFWVPTKLFR